MIKIALNNTLMEKDADNKSSRFFCFDFIRAIATMMVIIVHFDVEALMKYPNSHIVWSTQILNQYLGDVGVTLFIILSGAALMISGNKNIFSTTEYLKKRFLAIFPSFWLCYLAFAFGIIILGHSLERDGQYWKIILTIIGLDGFFLYRMTNFYLIGEWFTGFILIVYLFFPILRSGLLKAPLLTWGILALIFSILGYVYPHIFKIAERCNPLMRLPDFFFGMFFMKYVIRQDKTFTYSFIPSALLTLLFCFWKPPIHDQSYLFISGICLFITLAYISNKLYFGILLTKIINFLSKYSFVAFLVHHQFISISLQKINTDLLSSTQMHMYFLAIVILSYGVAVAMEYPIQKLTTFLRKILLKKENLQQIV